LILRVPRVTEISRRALTRAYYEWLLDQADKEAQSGCARLRRVQDDQTAYFLEQTAGWPPVKVAALMRGHIKLGWRKYVPPPKLTPEEKEAFPIYEWPVFTPEAISRTKVVWELQQRFIQHEFKIDKKVLRRQVKGRLDRALGKGVVLMGTLRYASAVGNFTVFTDIDYPAKGTAQLRYGQSVLQGWPGHETGTFDNRMVLSRASVSDLLGGPEAQWSCLTDADVPAAIEALADFCTEFLAELPKILEAARK
jgi:hypothetical protein